MQALSAIHPAREAYGFIPGQVVLALILIISVGLFFLAVFKRWRLMQLAQPENRFDKIFERVKSVIIYTVFHTQLFRKPLSGILHFMIFWGFVVFTFGYIFLIGSAYINGFTIDNIFGHTIANTYAGFQNFFAVLVIVGIGLALFQRLVLRPERLQNTTSSIVILFLIFFIMVTYFVSDSILVAKKEESYSFAMLSQAMGKVFEGGNESLLTGLFYSVWWIHLGLILSFLIYLPHSKHFHLILCPFNEFFRSLTPRGEMKYVDLEKSESFGVSNVTQFTWKDMLDFYSCTECGRCHEVCPATESQKPLDPKKIICNLRNHLVEKSDIILKSKDKPDERPNFVGSVITEDEIWACTTCGNCEEHCPVFIEQPDKILEMRRYLTLAESKFPNELKSAFKNMETNGNPWPQSWDQRAKWAEGLNVKVFSESSPKADYLLWVGCAGATDERNIKVAQAVVKLLQKAGVDFAILGNQERCCGDPARRLGNEYLYQTLVQENLENFKKYQFKQIIAYCPHCFNALKNEYSSFPQTGTDMKWKPVPVIHHTQLIKQLIQEGKLKIDGKFDKVVTYHDSCYLSRYNQICDDPRDILKGINSVQLKEMDRNYLESFCCGAGGGRMWLEEKIGKRINHIRTEEAQKTGASVIATACPYCLTMLGDGIKEKGFTETMKAKDIAEILVETMSGQV